MRPEYIIGYNTCFNLMSKLASKDKFVDLSDYGRPLAKLFANSLKDTKYTPIHVTLLFGVAGIIAVMCILYNYYWFAGFFLILKSIIDAADGELSRIKNRPSYTGRYLDSVLDIILNFMFLMAICYVSQSSFMIAIAAFLSIQLQGTLYNYYYVILRTQLVGGDKTSKIFEYETPKAFPYESQKAVNILFKMYQLLYGAFDRTIYFIEYKATETVKFPKWFMTFLSIYGLGFQLLIMAIMLSLDLVDFIIPFFIAYNFFMFVLIGIRKFVLL